MINPETQEKIARLWFESDCSTFEIARELELPVEDTAMVIKQLDKLSDIIRRVLLKRIKESLDIYE